jgi:hypothetical protein
MSLFGAALLLGAIALALILWVAWASGTEPPDFSG